MSKFRSGEVVFIKSTGEVSEVRKVEHSSMGHDVYYLEDTSFDSNYPFYETDLKSIDKELVDSGYSNYLDVHNYIDYEPELEKSLEDRVADISKTHRKTLDNLKDQELKFDHGKLRHSLLEPDFIEELIAVMEYGAKKYKKDSWKNVSEQRYADALYRHFLEYSKGAEFDVESGISHMAHIAANAQFIFWHIQQERKKYEE